jgi:hypothetical protein
VLLLFLLLLLPCGWIPALLQLLLAMSGSAWSLRHQRESFSLLSNSK